MKERLKSLVLLVLVVTSVTLSSEVWLGYYSVPTTPPPVATVIPPEPVTMLAPIAVYAHSATASRMFSPGEEVYEATWGQLRGVLKASSTLILRLGTAGDWDRARRGGSLEFRLSGAVPLNLLLDAVGTAPLNGAHAFTLDRLMLHAQSGHLYLLDTMTNRFTIWENAGATVVGTGLRDAVVNQLAWVAAQQGGQSVRLLNTPWRARASTWVYVPSRPGTWPQLLASHERQISRNLANSFFRDTSLVRRVGERDGRVSLTDGVQHVYLHADGTIQFVATSWFVPTQDIAMEASQALGRGLSFVAQHGGFTDDARLFSTTVEPARGDIASQIQFEFRPYTGITIGAVRHFVPIVAWGTQLMVAVNEREVAYYYRSMYVPITTGASPTDIVRAEDALKAVDATLTPGRLITQMYLGFYQREIENVHEFLYPVWVIEQGDDRFLVNAFTADVIAAPSARISLIDITATTATWDIGVPHALSQYAEFRLEYRRDGQVVHRDQWLSPGGPSYAMTRATQGLAPNTTYTVYFYARRGELWRVVDGEGRRITTRAR